MAHANAKAWGADKPRQSLFERNANLQRAGAIRAERRFQGEEQLGKQADIRPVSWER
jgi:hypothetical protein